MIMDTKIIATKNYIVRYIILITQSSFFLNRLSKIIIQKTQRFDRRKYSIVITCTNAYWRQKIHIC